MTSKHETLVKELFEIAKCEKENGASDIDIAVAMFAMALVVQFDANADKVAPENFDEDEIDMAKQAAATQILSRYLSIPSVIQ